MKEFITAGLFVSLICPTSLSIAQTTRQEQPDAATARAMPCELLSGMIVSSYSASPQCKAIGRGAERYLDAAMKMKNSGFPPERYVEYCADGIRFLKQYERDCPLFSQ